MAIATVACTKCKQTFRSSDDVKDTRIRCPLCGFAFVVKDFADEAAAQAKAKPKARDDDDDEDEEDNAKPINLHTIDLAPRCPNCANEMESEDAVICLYCGYNTQTRTLGKTTKTLHQSGGDKFQWLLPGMLSLLGLFALILLQVIFILGFGASTRGDDGWMANLLFTEPIYLWLTMISAGVMWGVGRFVFKRLILEPTPPEEVVD